MAEKILPSFSLSDFLGLKPKVQELADQLHQQALLTPDPNDDNINFVQYLYDYVSAAPITRIMPDWFKEILILITGALNSYSHNFVQWLFKQTYKIITDIVMFNPAEWIFDNTWFPSSIQKFTLISIAIIILFTMIEGIKRMCKLSNTPFTETLKKLPIMLGVSCASPFIFTNGLKYLNKACKLVLNFASEEITTAGSASVWATSVMFDPVNLILMFVFIGVVCWNLFPLIVFNAKRWWDIVVNAVLCPLAMSAWLFRSTEHFFHMWLRNIKGLALSQLLYAAYVAILGLIMFATPNPITISGVFAKTLITIGGIYSVAHPPNVITQYDNGKYGIKEFKETYKNGKEKLDKAKEVKTKGENVLVGGAKIAGLAYRIIFKR